MPADLPLSLDSAPPAMSPDDLAIAPFLGMTEDEVLIRATLPQALARRAEHESLFKAGTYLAAVHPRAIESLLAELTLLREAMAMASASTIEMVRRSQAQRDAGSMTGSAPAGSVPRHVAGSVWQAGALPADRNPAPALSRLRNPKYWVSSMRLVAADLDEVFSRLRPEQRAMLDRSDVASELTARMTRLGAIRASAPGPELMELLRTVVEAIQNLPPNLAQALRVNPDDGQALPPLDTLVLSARHSIQSYQDTLLIQQE